MSQLGLGVMIKALGGNSESAQKHDESIGKKISNAELSDNIFTLKFEDKSTLSFSDEGQSCCEHRYMRTDDDPLSLIGDIFRGSELSPVDYKHDEDYGDVSEIQFLRIHTNQNILVISNHNNHNGYYGGFWIVCK